MIKFLLLYAYVHVDVFSKSREAKTEVCTKSPAHAVYEGHYPKSLGMVHDFWYGPPSVETRHEYQLLQAVIAGKNRRNEWC